LLGLSRVGGKWSNERPDDWARCELRCADHLGGRGLGRGERRVLREPAHPDRQQRSPRKHPVAACRLTPSAEAAPQRNPKEMHIVLVEALLIAIYLGKELLLIDIRKPFLVEYLSRPI
jgi:hypothetical protein